ncbi:MAG: hypothetical protein L0287_15345, partial [Anaerolineae bacterium]|nr:hypothetical protein [Anaerolineae bacterium]
LVQDTNRRQRIFAGGYDGFVYKLNQVNRSVNGTAISMNAQTPGLTYGEEWLLKNLGDVGVSLEALNNNNVTLTWVRDGVESDSTTVTQGSVGGIFDTGLFDTAVFGGQTFTPRFFGIVNGGDFRSCSYKFSDTANDSDLSIHSFMSKLSPAGESQENL